MKFKLLSLCLLFGVYANAQQTTFYKEQYRPQYHFTPAIHWTNDPNGLVYFKGEYHMFYQFNPMGNRWGHMSWGHGISKDLVHWEHLPVAIPEDKDTMIFSGSCVVDQNNSSGFATKAGEVPMVAIYTGHIEGKNQSQHIAYSLDEGRSWKKYNHNPVLDLNKKDFRDPKVFWYEEGKKWIMATAFPIEREMHFFGSKNLKEWEALGSFGPAGDTVGIWECPDLFQLDVENEPGKKKWVLMHSPAPWVQYFVGEFDGNKFINENEKAKIFYADYGPDYYAAISFNNIPAGAKPVSLGWANNWAYANDIPTSTWKSAMSLPRTMSLKKIDNNYVLIQRPVEAIKMLRGKTQTWKNVSVTTINVLPVKSQQAEFELDFKPGPGVSGIQLVKGAEHFIEVGYDSKRAVLYVDRTKAGENDFNKNFPKLNRNERALKTLNGHIKLRVFIDNSILEVYANDGELVFTEQLFPAKKDNAVALFSGEGKSIFETVQYWEMKSAW